MALEIAVLAEIDFSEPTSSKQTQEPVTAELLSDAIEHIYPLLPLAAFWILLGPGDGFNRLLYILFRPLVSLIALKDSAPLYLIVLLLEVRMPPFSDETNLSAAVIGSTKSLDAENNPFEALPS